VLLFVAFCIRRSRLEDVGSVIGRMYLVLPSIFSFRDGLIYGRGDKPSGFADLCLFLCFGLAGTFFYLAEPLVETEF